MIASAFADLGFDAGVGPRLSNRGEVACQAADAAVHVVGVISPAAGHLTLVPQLRDELGALDRPHILTLVGGVVAPAGVPRAMTMDVAAVFRPGTVIAEALVDLLARSCRTHRPSSEGRRE